MYRQDTSELSGGCRVTPLFAESLKTTLVNERKQVLLPRKQPIGSAPKPLNLYLDVNPRKIVVNDQSADIVRLTLK